MATDSERGRAELRERRARLQALRRRAGSSRAAADGGASPVADTGRAVAGDAADAAPLTGPAQRFFAGLSGETARAGESGPDDDGPFTGPAQRFWAGLTGETAGPGERFRTAFNQVPRPARTKGMGPGQRLMTALTEGDVPATRRPALGIAALLEGVLRTRSDHASPTIPGTTYTEEGVSTLLGWLQNRSVALRPGQRRVAQMMHFFLTAPPRDGAGFVAGANVENLKRLEVMLSGTGTGGPAPFVPAGARDQQREAAAARNGDADVEGLRIKIAELSDTIEELTKRLNTLSPAPGRVKPGVEHQTKPAKSRQSPREKDASNVRDSTPSSNDGTSAGDSTASAGKVSARASAPDGRPSRRPAAARRKKS